MRPTAQACETVPPAGLGRWLAGRTLRTRLIAGLLVLFTVASVGVGLATALALRGFLLNRLDQQVITAGGILTDSIEHPPNPSHPSDPSNQGPGGEASEANPCAKANEYSFMAAGQAVRTLAARFKDGKLSYACIVTDAGGRPGLTSAHLSAADLAALARLPRENQPYSRHLSSLGDYRMTAFMGRDGDVHIAGLPLSGVAATVERLGLIELIVFGAALLVIGVAGAGWVRLSLRPLGRMAATAAEVAELPLASGEVELPHRVPDADRRTEVGKLGEAFNRMLGHVESSLAKRQASEARLRRFVADASHELRTPLAGIRAYAELALRSPTARDPDLRHALGRVDAESTRMSRLVDDLLLLARIDAGRPLAHEPVDLTRLAIDATNDARVAGAQRRWALDLPDEPVVITGDQHRLHQVLANLLNNARAHTPPRTTVTVRLIPAPAGPSVAGPANTGPATDGVELTVSDDGPGIPPELQEVIWERFARGDTARSRRAGSTGLGLAIVAAVVTAHHGTMSVTSRPGKTTFSIWLPRTGQQPTAQAFQQPVGRASQRPAARAFQRSAGPAFQRPAARARQQALGDEGGQPGEQGEAGVKGL